MRKEKELRRAGWARVWASPVLKGACALWGRGRGGGARWEGPTAPSSHHSDLLLPGLGRWGGVGSCLLQRLPGVVQHGGGTGLGHHLQEGLISAWRSGQRCRSSRAQGLRLHALSQTPALVAPPAAGFPAGTQRKEGAQGGSAAAPGFLKPWATRRAWKGKGSPKDWRRRQRQQPEEGLAGRGAPCTPWSRPAWKRIWANWAKRRGDRSLLSCQGRRGCPKEALPRPLRSRLPCTGTHSMMYMFGHICTASRAHMCLPICAITAVHICRFRSFYSS